MSKWTNTGALVVSDEAGGGGGELAAISNNTAQVVPATSAEESAFDTDDDWTIDPPCRALWVGTGGNVRATLADDSTPVTFANVQDGTLLPFSIQMIHSIGDGTTASDLVALR